MARRVEQRMARAPSSQTYGQPWPTKPRPEQQPKPALSSRYAKALTHDHNTDLAADYYAR